MKKEPASLDIDDTVDKLLSYVPGFTVEELQVMTEVCAKWGLQGTGSANIEK